MKMIVGLTLFISMHSFAQSQPSPFFSINGESRNLAELQKKYEKAVTPNIPWSGYWWPYHDLGLANKSFGTDSPLDKYDRAINAKNTPQSAANWERLNRISFEKHFAANSGHCNGWAAASMSQLEPKHAVTINDVTFEIGEIKALLAGVYQYSNYLALGTRVFQPAMFYSDKDAGFNDVWPNQFHLALTNTIGRQGVPFAADLSTGDLVNNHPIFAYEFKKIAPEDYLGEVPKHPGLYALKMDVTIWYVDFNATGNDPTPRFEFKKIKNHFLSRRLTYEVWMNGPAVFDNHGQLASSGDLIWAPPMGSNTVGRWQNHHVFYKAESHPDFIWFSHPELPTDNGFMHGVSIRNPYLNVNWVLQLAELSRK